jgi:hypothetical protein
LAYAARHRNPSGAPTARFGAPKGALRLAELDLPDTARANCWSKLRALSNRRHQRDPRQTLSRQPSPRLDQLRALREASFARAEQLRKEAAKAAEGRGTDAAAPREPAPPAPANESAPKRPAKAKASPQEQAAGKAVSKPADKKQAAAKTTNKTAAKKTAKKKSGK